ncbi:MAG TPA: ABC transporter permease [Pyrinomonadaceae bacterium]|nr:ABC transporter permease [Pyrinomonadaceae bacterium]
MRQLFGDMRYGLRMLLKSPGWAVVMCATLALGVGLTTAIFSLTYSILLHALPYPEPERLVSLWMTSSGAAKANVGHFNVGAADWTDWRAQSKVFEDIALTRIMPNFNLTGDGAPERVRGARVTWNLPQVLGLQPMLGRMFTEEETRSNARVALVSYGFWERRFARDPGVLGRTIQLNGETFQVVGVMPPEFRYPTKESEVWTPLFVPPAELGARWGFNYRAVARLKPGVSVKQAQGEMSTIMRGLAQQYPTTNADLGVFVEPLLDSTVGQFRTTLYALLAAVSSLLLIGCINLGGLLVVRASARSREFVVRAALGASAARLRRQTLAEVMPVSVIGAIGGVLLAWGLLKLLVRWLPPQLPGVESVGLHGPVLAVAVAVSVLVALVAGMLPARLASRVQLAAALQQESRTVVGGGKLRNAFVVAQIAVSLVLVFASGLLVRSFVAVMSVNPGFSPQGALTMQLAVTRAKYPTEQQVSDYYRRLIGRVKSVSGVVEAGMINLLPLSEGRLSGPVYFEGRPEGEWVGADSRSVTPGYFPAMGIPLLRGRDFSEHDGAETPRVCVVDEQLVRSVFGGADPLGKRLRFGVVNANTPWVEIVGVVGHVRGESLETDPRPQVYWPLPQQPQDRVALVLRTAGRPESFASAVVEQIHAEDPEQPVYDIRSMGEWIDMSFQSRNLLTGLVTLFGGSSLLLACLGLYGVVSYGAGLRSREFAIRSALGARPGNISRLVLSHALRLWVLGSLIGLLVAWPAGRALQTLLYGVGSADAMSLAAAPSLLLVTSLLAGLGPALRAGRIDPAVTLRGD